MERKTTSIRIGAGLQKRIKKVADKRNRTVRGQAEMYLLDGLIKEGA